MPMKPRSRPFCYIDFEHVKRLPRKRTERRQRTALEKSKRLCVKKVIVNSAPVATRCIVSTSLIKRVSSSR